MTASSQAILVILIPGSITLIVFLCACILLSRRGFREGKEAILQTGLKIKYRCETCGQTFEIPAEEFYSAKHRQTLRLDKRERTGKPTKVGGVIPGVVSVQHATSSRRYFECPVCHQKTWNAIINLDEYYQVVLPIARKRGFKTLAFIVVAGILCLILMGMLTAVVKGVLTVS